MRAATAPAASSDGRMGWPDGMGGWDGKMGWEVGWEEWIFTNRGSRQRAVERRVRARQFERAWWSRKEIPKLLRADQRVSRFACGAMNCEGVIKPLVCSGTVSLRGVGSIARGADAPAFIAMLRGER